jgi:diguanylate cyclase (GGDEF)-like protein
LPHKNVTVSIGIACFNGKENKKIRKEDLIHKADEALYQAKDSGRNLVIVKK